MNIREELVSQMSVIETKKEQFTLNDLTITRIDDFTNLNYPNVRKLLSCNTNINDEIMPRKKICTDKKNEILNAIKSTLTDPFMKGLHEVAGLENEKHLLKKAIVYPVLYPHLFNGIFYYF